MNKGFVALLKYPDFLKLWAGKVVSRFGDSLDSIAYMWMVYQLTGSGLLMGSLMAVNFIPNLAFGIVGGVFADRGNKKLIMLVGDAGRGVMVALTAALYITNTLEVWHLFVFTFINSTFESFSTPARTAVIPLVVTNQDDFLAANSLSQASSSLAEIIGLGVAGVIIGVYGIAAAIIIDAVSFFVCVAFIAWTRIPSALDNNSASKNKAAFSQDLRQGFKLAVGNELIRLCIVFGVALNASVSPFSVLAPIYADTVLNSGAQGYASLSLSISLSTMLGALFLGQFGNRFTYSQLIVTGSVLMSTGFAGLCLSKVLLPAIAGAAFIGLGVATLRGAMFTIIMTRCDKVFLGRVSSVVNSVMMAAMPASTAGAGVFVQRFSPSQIFGVISVLVLITGVWIASSKALHSGQIVTTTQHA